MIKNLFLNTLKAPEVNTLARFSVFLFLFFHLYSNAQNKLASSSNIIIYGNAQIISAKPIDDHVQTRNSAEIVVIGSAKVFQNSDSTDQILLAKVKTEPEKKKCRKFVHKDFTENKSVAESKKSSEKLQSRDESFVSSKSKEQILNASTSNNNLAVLNFTNLVLKAKDVISKSSAQINFKLLDLAAVQIQSNNISFANQLIFLRTNSVRPPPFFII